MPNSLVLSAAVDRAANCAAGVVTRSDIHARAVHALVMVSIVVKVFEATMTNVVSGFSSRKTSLICAPSTLDTK